MTDIKHRTNPPNHNAGHRKFVAYAKELGPDGQTWGDLMVFGYPHSDIGPFIYLDAIDIVNEGTEQETLQDFVIRLSPDYAVLLATRLLEVVDDIRRAQSDDDDEQTDDDEWCTVKEWCDAHGMATTPELLEAMEKKAAQLAKERGITGPRPTNLRATPPTGSTGSGRTDLVRQLRKNRPDSSKPHIPGERKSPSACDQP
jgi:hypothetical protein